MLFYALTIFLSAFLLFQVQPLIAKMILPWFGGSAAVWATCLLFFQTVLLLGYAYSHGIVMKLKPKQQWILHGTLLGLCPVCLAHRSGSGVETGRPQRARLAHPRPARRHRRTALLRALHHRPAGPGVVCPGPPRRDALPALRPVEPRLDARPADLPRADRAGLLLAPPGLGLVDRLWLLCAAVRLDRLAEPARRLERRARWREPGAEPCRGRRNARRRTRLEPAPILGRAGRRPVHVAAIAHQPFEHGRCADPIPLDFAPRALPAQLHPVLRRPALVPPQTVLMPHAIRARRDHLADDHRTRRSAQCPPPHRALLPGLLRLLHGLPRRVVAPETAPPLSDRLLPDDRGRRRLRRRLRRAVRACRVQRLP